MTRPLELAIAVDDLYRRAVEAPEQINEPAVAEWMADVADGVADRELAKSVRAAARRALKLARYWSDPARDVASLGDWRNGVDEALGAVGWRPGLDIARRGLALAPDPELYDEVKSRFRMVNFVPWMEGVAYAEWFAARDD